ncbi:ATP-binding protein [Pseudobutyrivibrio sp. 49]|uniref:ATP-binding protein n=1 Tax=Pseudobutyrivibrio sp. 49 TaxID=1855344 RepID=UPI0015A345CE|nr:ATP-binding protein [Pseudobutyrivibrio sp. 49]
MALYYQQGYLLMHVVGVLFILVVNKLDLKELVYYNVWAITFTYLIQQLSATVADIMTPHNILLSMPIGKCFAFAIVIPAEVVTLHFLKEKRIKNMKWEQIGISAFLCGAICTMNTLCFNYMSRGSVTLYLFQLFSVFSIILVLWLQLAVYEGYRKEKEASLMRYLWYAHKHEYEMKKEYVDIINRKYHDLKHEIVVLKGMHPEDRMDRINQLEETIDLYDSMIHSGNSILDTILNEKRIQCLKNDIQFVCRVEMMDISFIDIIDLSILLGNALNNAIEAVKRLDVADRVIDFKMYKDCNFVKIIISNRFNGELHFTGAIPDSTKENTFFHGFGIKSIKNIVDKYHGEMVIDGSNNIFKLNMILMMQE